VESIHESNPIAEIVILKKMMVANGEGCCAIELLDTMRQFQGVLTFRWANYQMREEGVMLV
jgi:hypothetical protein